MYSTIFKIKKELLEGRGYEELLFHECIASMWGGRKVLKMDGGDGYIVQCTTTSVFLMSLIHLLEMAKITHVITTCHVYFGLPWWLSSKESACNGRDPALITRWGRSPGGGNGNPLKCSLLGYPMNRATVHGISKSQTFSRRIVVMVL